MPHVVFVLPEGTNRQSTTSVESTMVVPKDITESDVKMLCKVFPKLIQWRMLVFYAPFFKGPSYQPSVLEPNVDHQREVPKSSTMHVILHRPASEYAAHKAYQQADAILDNLKQHAGVINLLELHRDYSLEQESFPRHPLPACNDMKHGYPTTFALNQIASRLNIPLCQIGMALAMYMRYEQLRCHELVFDSWPAEPVYNKLEVRRAAAQGLWQEVADAVHYDFRYIDNSKYRGPDSDSMTFGIERYKFRSVVAKCRGLYFVTLHTQGECGPCASRYRGTRDTADWTCPDMKRSTKGKLSAMWKYRPFKTFNQMRLPCKADDPHAHCQCWCMDDMVVKYTLQKAEQLRTDGSFTVIKEMSKTRLRQCKRALPEYMASWVGATDTRRKPMRFSALGALAEEEDGENEDENIEDSSSDSSSSIYSWPSGPEEDLTE